MSFSRSISGGINQTLAVDIGYNEISAAATTFNYEAIQLPAYAVVKSVSFFLLEVFDGGATSDLTIQVGDGADPNGYITAKVVHVDATEVFAGITDGAYLTVGTDINTGNGKLYGSGGDTIDVLFTATGANTSALTQGKVRVVVNFDNISQA